MKAHLCVVSAASLLACTGLARAQSIDWAAAVSGNWNVPASWSPANIPDAPGESAVLGHATAYTVTLNIDPTLDAITITNPMATLNLGGRTIITTGGVASSGLMVANAGTSTIAGNVTLGAAGAGVNVNAGTALNLSGPTLTNAGQVIVNPTNVGLQTTLTFTADTAATGAGEIRLAGSDNRAIVGTGAGVTLTNAAGHTISGIGHLNALIDNQGVVTADVGPQTLHLQTNNKINSGTLKAESNGILRIAGIEIDQTGGGTLLAESGPVDLTQGIIRGGTVDGGGSRVAAVSGTSFFDSPTLANAVQINAGAIVALLGSGVENNGVFTVNPTNVGLQTLLRIDAPVTLSGTGDLVLAGSTNRALVEGAVAGNLLTNGPDHTIRGFGEIRSLLHNDGLLSADVAGQGILMNTEAKSNDGTMRAVGGATLTISGITVTQSALGLLLADAAEVQLTTASVIGGTIDTDNGGIVRTVGGINAMTDVESLGDVVVNAGTHLRLLGAGFENSGTVQLNPTNAGLETRIQIAPGLTVSGPGEIAMLGFSNRAVLTNDTAGSFTQAADHTIRGFGEFRAEVVNNGLVSADVLNQTLLLTTGTKTNNAVMEATSGGTLALSTSVLQGPAGRMTGDAGALTFTSSSVTGGLISTVNGGSATWIGGSNSLTDLELDAAAAQNAGVTINLFGTITHNGVLTVNPTNAGVETPLRLADGAVIDGEGEVRLAGFLNRALINSLAGTATQEADHSIKGFGEIRAALTNNGLISADVAGQALRLDAEPKTNNGIMEAVGGGTLEIVSTTITQTAQGVIDADGSTVSVTTSTITGGTLDGAAPGVYTIGGASTFSDLTIDAPSVTLPGGTQLGIAGPVTSNAAITVNPTNAGVETRLRFTQSTTLAGSGSVTLAGSQNRALIDVAMDVTGTFGPGQTVRGIGELRGPLVMNGTLAPGLSVGTLRSNANLTMNPSSTLAVEIASAASADRIDGSGTLNAGGAVTVTLLDGFIPATNTTWTIVTNAAVNGRFDLITAPNLGNPSFVWRLAYTPTSVRLGYVCRADWNADGAVNTADFFEFFSAFFGSPPDADFNNDGATNTADFFEFFAAFFGPPCV